MSAQHTPGPSFMSGWEANCTKGDRDEYFEILTEIIPGKVGPVADTLNCHHCLTIEDQEKVARLLAAAPELLEALQKIEELLEPCIGPTFEEAHGIARAAISRAERQQS